MLATEAPFPQYFDLDGDPLDGGKLYFGVVDQNPETAPITVYWDAAGTQPAAQPIRTMNGYTVRNGTPALVFADSDYSLTVRDRRGRLVTYTKNSAEFSSSQSLLTLITNFIASVASSIGSSLVGFIQAGAGAVLRTAQDKMRERVSAADYGFTPGNGIAYSAASVNSIIATLAAQGKKLIFPAGVFLWDDTIIIPNGGSIEGAGSGYSDNAKAFTKFVCQSNVASSVIRFYDAGIPGYIEAYCVGIWATYSTAFDHVTFAGNLRRGFFLDNQLTNATLDDLYASECRYGYYAPKSLWSCNVGTLSATLCYMAWFSGIVDYSTSLAIRGLQIWRCFHGAFFGKTTYCTINGYFDSCGLAPGAGGVPARLQVANEVPLGLVFSEAKGVALPYWGSESSSCIQAVATNFSTVKFNAMRLDQNATTLWRYDAARTFPAWMPALASTKQALFLTSDSVLEVSGLSSSLSGVAPTANDLFAATTGNVNPNINGIVFENCFVDAPAYVIDYPKSSTNPAATYYSNNIKCNNVLKQFVLQATTNLGLAVQCDENGVGASKITPNLWIDADWKRYKLQKASGQEGWEAGTTLALNLNVRLGLDYWAASLRIVVQPSEAAGAARATAGVQEVLLDVQGNSNVVTGITARSATGGVTASLDGAHPTFILINGLVNRINFDVFVEETVNRFARADFPVSLVAS